MGHDSGSGSGDSEALDISSVVKDLGASINDADLEALKVAMTAMTEALNKMSEVVESADDVMYTVAHGGHSFTIETADLEEEAEADYRFLKDT